MAKSAKRKKEKIGGKAKIISPYHQELLDAIVLAKSENDTKKVRLLEKIISRIKKGD